MASTPDPQREHGSTYVAQGGSPDQELTRLQIQDQLFTTGMGGVLPEQPDPTIFQRVLDVGCGPGGWLIETAKTYPSIKQLVGVDVNSRMLEYARTQAQAQQVSDRVQFRIMDALLMLEFPADSFDLVNMRFGVSFLRLLDWPKLLREYQRVTRPGGVICVTEGDFSKSNSPTLTRLTQMLVQAFYQSGHYVAPEGDGGTRELARLLDQYGVQNVQTRLHKLEFRAGTVEAQSLYEDIKHVFRTALPFLRKWTQVPADYETIYQQALSEMQQPDFTATWDLLTVWGNKPL